ncbi:MAG: hypothetical protein EON96_10605, partial [Caulobacteraceae bacterium]
VLTRSQAYGGDVIVQQGALTVTAPLSAASIALSGDTSFIVDVADGMTLTPGITGTGAVEKNGLGVLTLAPTANIQGPLNVNAGAVIINSVVAGHVQVATETGVSVVGAVTGDIRNDGNVLFARSGVSFYDGAISGSGTVTVPDFSRLILSGANTYTGLTRVGRNGGLVVTGSIAGDVASEGATTFSPARTMTYGGVISGAGGLIQAGSGRSILTGASTYSGNTQVNGGSLIINGSIGSNTIVNSGGVLGGVGTINGFVRINSGGRLEPGNSPGLLTVNGPLLLVAGSTTAIEVDPRLNPNHDQINVAGAAVIQPGAKLAVQPLGAMTNYGRIQRYTILAANGGVSGTFIDTDISSTMAFLTPVPLYSVNRVDLALIRNDISFASLAATPNQAAVAAAAQTAGIGAAAYDALIGQDDQGARAGYDALSGEFYGAAGDFLIDRSRYQREALLTRATDGGPRGAWAQVLSATTRADALNESADT